MGESWVSWEVIGVGKVNSDKLAQPSTRLALFFPYSHPPSMDELLSPMDELEFEPPSPTDELPSPLLKSRIPRKTVIRVFDRNLWELFVLHVSKFEHQHSPCRLQIDEESRIKDLHCPLRKGIIYYRREGVIFEHNIHSSGKHEVDSHATHWESRRQLTMPSSHKSLSQNIRRCI